MPQYRPSTLNRDTQPAPSRCTPNGALKALVRSPAPAGRHRVIRTASDQRA
ncbi:hypothetical protein PGTUg99_034411 [Puccinia graminis f. sp. tritici]|uniref:Uncharacterized protein n=1 Tax=Puccinia graminis f. sp. tritici TaxID=56615 RepID=A0A5B0RYN6_PUCGR|nr:hypothetical protein PGTUg99_034411 [Puccinia graminis f. sp. tritici]